MVSAIIGNKCRRYWDGCDAAVPAMPYIGYLSYYTLLVYRACEGLGAGMGYAPRSCTATTPGWPSAKRVGSGEVSRPPAMRRRGVAAHDLQPSKARVLLALSLTSTGGQRHHLGQGVTAAMQRVHTLPGARVTRCIAPRKIASP